MVGEIRDAETAEIALKAAQTGHLVLSTLHTNSTSETLTRLQQWASPAATLAGSGLRTLLPRILRPAGAVRSAACYPGLRQDSPGLNAIEIESLARAAGMMTLLKAAVRLSNRD